MLYYHLRHIDKVHSRECGLAMLNPGWCHMRRIMETESVLIIGKRGSAVLEDNGTQFEINEGSMLLLPAGHLHRGTQPVSKPLSYWWFHFNQFNQIDDEIHLYLPRALPEAEAVSALGNPQKKCALFKNGIILPQTMPLCRPELIKTLCSEALQLFASSEFSLLAYNNALERLLLELQADALTQTAAVTSGEAQKSASHTLVKKVLEKIESELSNPNASVKYFADALSVNADYLGRCFKQVQHEPVGQYINRRRIELACNRLRENNFPVETVAAECGFGSRRQFFDEFKRRTGTTPAAYRAESAYVGINAL